MPDAGAFNIGGAYIGAGAIGAADAAARADASPAAEAARRAALEGVRIGDQRALREAVVALIATGDLVPAASYQEPDDDDEKVPEEEQSEPDMGDEDEPRLDGWDDEPHHRPENPLKPSGDQADDFEAIENCEPFRILVEGNSCQFERPDWWNCRPVAKAKAGLSLVADTERKFRMMSAIASWLAENRKAFLLDPDPWHLGVSALDEFKQGWASVRQKDFLVRAKLEHFAGTDLFSRDIRNTDLVFEDGQVPLGFLFEDDARMAWVAQVVKGLAKGTNMAQVLENYAHVTVPKGGLDDLMSKKPEALDFGSLTARACGMAGKDKPVSWSATIKRFKSNLLK